MTVGLLGWVCYGLGWLVVTVGLQWFVFVCDLVVVVVVAVVVGLWVVVETLQEKMFIATKKNHYNNIRVVEIVDTRCCNKI